MPSPEHLSNDQVPSLSYIVNKAYTNFFERDSVVNEFGDTESYSSFHAASDAVKESGLSASQLFFSLTGQTRYNPLELGISEGEGKSWDELFAVFSEYIIERELSDNYPQVIVESEKRVNGIDGEGNQ